MSGPTTAQSNLHREIVTGVVKIIKYRSMALRVGNTSGSLEEFSQVGTKGKSEEAQMHIREFVKDGVINLTQEQIDQVDRGYYSALWSLTNAYLENFGHARVKPITIEE